MNPGAAHLEAFFAAARARAYRLDGAGMRTSFAHCDPLAPIINTKSGRLLHLGVIPEMPEAFRDRYERQRLLRSRPACQAASGMVRSKIPNTAAPAQFRTRVPP